MIFRIVTQLQQNNFFRILDYLLGLHRGLSTATFPDEFARDRSARSDDSENWCSYEVNYE